MATHWDPLWVHRGGNGLECPGVQQPIDEALAHREADGGIHDRKIR
jgi:hypothetical protein